jgi:hypothetical protein
MGTEAGPAEREEIESKKPKNVGSILIQTP